MILFQLKKADLCKSNWKVSKKADFYASNLLRGECSLLIAETADVYDSCSGVMCKKGLIVINSAKP